MLRSKFPIGENVTGVRLVSILVSEDPLGVVAIFSKGSSRLYGRFIFPKKSVWKDGTYAELTRVTLLMESLFLTFLTPSQVQEAKSSSSDNPTDRLKEYIGNINTELRRAGAFEEPLSLKVIQDKSGNPSLPRYVAYGNHYMPYVKKESDLITTLRYSRSEKQLL